MNKPLISILLPVYNAEKYITFTLESIVNCYLPNIEIIIIDDGSKDSTKEIIDNYSKKNLNLRYFFKSNSGIADSLNYGLKKCEGAWVARIDSDDLCICDRFNQQIKIAERFPNFGLIGSAALFIDQFGNNLYSSFYPSSHNQLVNNLLNNRDFFPHSSAFFNRDLVKSLGGYRNRLIGAEDWDLWIRISEVSQISCVNKTLVKVRIHNNQISKNNYGFDQAYDSRISIISYWYRKNKNFDPISKFSDNEFLYFKNFICNRLKRIYLEEYLFYVTNTKNTILQKVMLSLKFLTLIVNPKKFVRFIQHKFFSKYLIFNLARSLHSNFG